MSTMTKQAQHPAIALMTRLLARWQARRARRRALRELLEMEGRELQDLAIGRGEAQHLTRAKP